MSMQTSSPIIQRLLLLRMITSLGGNAASSFGDRLRPAKRVATEQKADYDGHQFSEKSSNTMF